MDLLRPPGIAVAPVVAGAVVVAAGCEVEGAAVDAGWSGFLNVLKGALVVAVADVEGVGVPEAEVAGAGVPRLNTFVLGVVDDVVGVLLKKLPKAGALVAGGLVEGLCT